MADAYKRYGEEQKRLIEQYYVPPGETPPGTPPGDTVPLPPGYTESQIFFEDTFRDTTLDLSKWSPSVGDPKWGIWPGGLPVDWSNPDNSLSGMGPWSNNWEYFSPEQVKTGDGCTLTAVRDRNYSDLGYEWKSGIIRSKVLLGDGLARFEVMLSKGSGHWGGCWLLNNLGSDFEPDLIETGFIPFAAGATQDSSAATTLHDGEQSQVRYDAGDLTSNYRVFDCEYRPGSHVAFWLDGIERHRVSTNVRCECCAMVNNSVASPVAANWHSQVDDLTPEPMLVKIRRVAFYQRA